MSYLAFSKRLAGYLTGKTGLATEKRDVLAYIIEVLVINLANVIAALMLGAFLGVLRGTVACLVAAALFRQTAGGAHSESPWRCAVVTVAVFPALARLAAFLSKYAQTAFIDILAAVAVAAGFLTVILLAPVDSPNAPVLSPLRRKKLKVLSLAVFMIISAAAIILRRSDWVYAPEISVCLVLSVIWVSFMLSGPGHRAMRFIDKIKIGRR